MYINLTPHDIDVFTESAFQGLTQVNPSTWVADSVFPGQSIGAFPPAIKGGARIATTTIVLPHGPGDIPLVATEYGLPIGIPDNVQPEDILIVSLPMLSMLKEASHPLTSQCVSPWKVVRSSSNGSVVLGCMGFTK